MSKVIAVVRLAQGQVAFYDEISGVHLTIGNPIADIFDYTNTTRIRNAVANKVLNLITGSFIVENTIITEPVIEKSIEIKAKAKLIEVEEPIVIEEDIKIEETEVLEEEVIEETEVETELNIKPKNKRKKREE